MVLPADEDATLPLYPGEEAARPASAACSCRLKPSPILRGRLAWICNAGHSSRALLPAEIVGGH